MPLRTLPIAVGWVALAIAVGSATPPARAQSVLPAYFQPGMPPSVAGGGCPALPRPFAVIPTHWWQQTTPPEPAIGNDPPDTCLTFAFGPLTDASEQAVGAFSTSQWTGGLWPRIWGRRGPRPPSLGFADPGSNPVYPYIHTTDCKQPSGPIDPTMYLGDDYSSVTKANAVTEAEILRMLGATASAWQAPLIAAGFNPNTDLISYLALQANPGDFVNFNADCNSHDGKSYVTIDKFIVHDQPNWVYVNGTSTPPTGVMIDWEVNDFRSTSDGALFLAKLASEIHAQTVGGVSPKAYLYTNPWVYVPLKGGTVTGGMAANGFDFYTIDQVKSAFNFISLYLLDNGAHCNIKSAYNTAISNIRGVSGVVNNSELSVTVDLGRCNEQAMLDLFHLNEAQNFGGYAIFPNQTTMGGQELPLVGNNLLLWRLMYANKALPN